MTRLEKVKIPALYVLSFLCSVLPVLIYFIVNNERYIMTTPDKVKILFGGVLLVGILVVKTLGYLKIKSALIFFGAVFILSYLLNSIIADIMVFSLLAFVGEAAASLIKVIIAREKKSDEDKKKESVIKNALDSFSGRV